MDNQFYNNNSFKRVAILFITLIGLVVGIILGQIQFIFLLFAAVYAIFIANRFPLFTIFLFIFTQVWPLFLQMTKFPIELTVLGVFRPSDLVVLSMAGAIFYNLIVNKLTQRKIFSVLGLLISIFSFWIIYEILRNYSVYGLSAPGEFRYRYLILVVPLYISLFLSGAKHRKKLFTILIIFSLILPLFLLPVIGSLKGWGVGPSNRFYPASISLGLFYGLIALIIGRKYKLIWVRSIVAWLISIPVLALILIDSHRSVWVAAFIALLMLFLLKEIRIPSLTRYIPVLFFLILIVIMVASWAGLDVVDYVITRASEIIHPQATDGTAAWRLEQWRVAMLSFQRSPIQGVGFGGYWETGVSPHSLYVQTLVKLGLVGMFLYAVIIFTLIFKMVQWIKKRRNKPIPELGIVITSLVILVAGHAFYSVYAFEEYTWLFLGLGMSVVNWNKSI
jgi:O-antigen ligase